MGSGGGGFRDSGGGFDQSGGSQVLLELEGGAPHGNAFTRVIILAFLPRQQWLIISSENVNEIFFLGSERK